MKSNNKLDKKLKKINVDLVNKLTNFEQDQIKGGSNWDKYFVNWSNGGGGGGWRKSFGNAPNDSK